MTPLDGLPADQRAVLQLVLRRGGSYDEIARLLSMDRAAVRERVLAAFDALGPDTRLPAERRALITDYLLGQLSEAASQETRERLAESASERAWARGLHSELAPLASSALPDVPMETAPATPGHAEGSAPQSPLRRRSFRLGGALLLAGVAVAVVVIVLTGGAKPSRPDSGIAYVSIVRHANAAAFAAGENTDRVLGAEAATYSLTVHHAGRAKDTFKLASKVVFYAPTGSLSGTATATITVSPKGATFTGGELSLKDGVGSQKGHSLIATFTGTGSPSANVYIFNYKGTYK